ncbi:FadR/GntR family transcriptional regulator [Ferdinandcohnia quinoae]|uniref:GntR family transcriptional regulator n=1 Tax=Fredinandcohnia quinoae TaxID=2918902 RepID=A0AAW5E4F7_9BACI|nr:GntR family transcriptional regulator [Fredinandcohnia sp. SECRCQ15]
MNSSPGPKVYIEIVNQIRSIINEDALTVGDKLPSERELSERLKVGRSSVREALRSLELLGLIETRRGEGTYLRDFEDHQFIQVLGTFILQGDKTKNDLIETKTVLERSCIELACATNSKEYFFALKDSIRNTDDLEDFFFKTLFEATNNRLLLRIWLIVNEYMKVLRTKQLYSTYIEDFEDILNGLIERNVEKALYAYEKMRTKEIVD